MVVRTRTVILAVSLGVVTILVFCLTFIPKLTVSLSGAHMFDKASHHTDSLVSRADTMASHVQTTGGGGAASKNPTSPTNRKSSKVGPPPANGIERPSTSVVARSRCESVSQNGSVGEDKGLVDKSKSEKEGSSLEDKYRVKGDGGEGLVSEKKDKEKEKEKEKDGTASVSASKHTAITIPAAAGTSPTSSLSGVSASVSKASGAAASNKAQRPLTEEEKQRKRDHKLAKAKAEFESGTRMLAALEASYAAQKRQLLDKTGRMRQVIYRLMCEVDFDKKRSSVSSSGDADK